MSVSVAISRWGLGNKTLTYRTIVAPIKEVSCRHTGNSGCELACSVDQHRVLGDELACLHRILLAHYRFLYP